MVACRKYLARFFFSPFNGSVRNNETSTPASFSTRCSRTTRPSCAPRRTERWSKKRLSAKRRRRVRPSMEESPFAMSASQPDSAKSTTCSAGIPGCNICNISWMRLLSSLLTKLHISPTSIQGLKPAWSIAWGSPRASNNARMMSTLTREAARCNGVAPELSTCMGFARPLNNSFVVARSPLITTFISAVTPSKPAPFGSARDPSSRTPLSKKSPSMSFFAPSFVRLPPTMEEAKSCMRTVARLSNFVLAAMREQISGLQY
mmetsp:Transcript_115077/g.325172  ORF Transcript_115077/g.325172 Transcript_115077/m.325172 type:complete len:261 (+) Transcript_115077:1581-2363(+)